MSLGHGSAFSHVLLASGTDEGWQQTEGIFCESVFLREGILPMDGEVVCPSRQILSLGTVIKAPSFVFLKVELQRVRI